MRLRALAMIVATFGLAACDRFISPQSSAEQCAGRFPEVRRLIDANLPRMTLRYAFEAQRADPTLIREGIEGVAPTSFVSISGSRTGGVQAEVDRLMASMSGRPAEPKATYFMTDPPWLIYAPGRQFSSAEATSHLAAMCALSSRGLILRSLSVSPQGPSE